MIEGLAAHLALSPSELAIVAGICFAAGIVRGFTGFALSAVIMAGAALILSPIELIPALWWMEVTSSLLMLRGGWRDADRPTALHLIGGSALGLPVGLSLTVLVSVEMSRLAALTVIMTLAAMLLAQVRIPALASRIGALLSGAIAGMVSGLAGVGGLVVALYVLAQDSSARSMRGSLIIYLLGSSLVGFLILVLYGVMDERAVLRGLFFSLPVGVGVLLGKLLFQPRWEIWYKPACLWLLVGLSIWGIVRVLMF